LRHGYLALAGRTLELVATPQFVARDLLIAVGTVKFDFSHNGRWLLARFPNRQPGEFFAAPAQGPALFTTLPGIRVKEMRIAPTYCHKKLERQMCSAIDGGGR
jgi:hypothetical protein